MPDMTLTSVDLPAPLSPTRPITSPARTPKSTPSSAWTAPKRLLTPCSSRRGAVAFMSDILSLVGLGDPGLLAVALEPTGADLRRRPEPVLDDRRLDVVLGHCHRLEQD